MTLTAAHFPRRYCSLAPAPPARPPLNPPQLNVTVSNHLRDLPELTSSIRFEVVTDATREALTGAWKTWMEETRETRVLGLGGLLAGVYDSVTGRAPEVAAGMQEEATEQHLLLWCCIAGSVSWRWEETCCLDAPHRQLGGPSSVVHPMCATAGSHGGMASVAQQPRRLFPAAWLLLVCRSDGGRGHSSWQRTW